MSLGFHAPAWRALWDALRELVAAIDGHGAAVLDVSNCLWCAYGAQSGPATFAITEAAAKFYEAELEGAGAAARRGGERFAVSSASGAALSYAAESLDGYYILAVFADEPRRVRFALRRAAPHILALTRALPPPDGPDREAAARRA